MNNSQFTHNDINLKLDTFIKNNNIPNIIFHGQPGSGKKTIVKRFIKNIYKNINIEKIDEFVLWVYCDHGQGIKFIRNEIKFFSKTNIISNKNEIKSIILFNADKLTVDAQSALRRSIELFNHNTRYFIVVENKNNLLKPILSRFCDIFIYRQYINNKEINLYEYAISNSINTESYINNITQKGIKIIYNLIIGDMSLKNIIIIIDELYLIGISAISMIDIIKNISVFDYTVNCVYIFKLYSNYSELDKQYVIPLKKYYELLMMFSNIKEEIRHEHTLMLFILTFLFINPKYDLKNISFM
jgi:DNA polymerase III delta prime subunit